MKVYTAEEVSKILKISKESVWRFGRTGQLKTVRIGRCVRFYLPEGMEK